MVWVHTAAHTSVASYTRGVCVIGARVTLLPRLPDRQAGIDLNRVRRQAAQQRRARRAPEAKGRAMPSIRLGGERPLLIGVILVGGATRMPGIRRLLVNMTGLPILETAVDPDQVDLRSRAGRGDAVANTGCAIPQPIIHLRPGNCCKTQAPIFQAFQTERPQYCTATQAVAAGAAIEAARLDGRLEGLAVMDEWRAALLRALTADNKDA